VVLKPTRIQSNGVGAYVNKLPVSLELLEKQNNGAGAHEETKLQVLEPMKTNGAGTCAKSEQTALVELV
jgi:hypothetical protein